MTQHEIRQEKCQEGYKNMFLQHKMNADIPRKFKSLYNRNVRLTWGPKSEKVLPYSQIGSCTHPQGKEALKLLKLNER